MFLITLLIKTYYFTTPAGRNPIREFILQLDEATQSKIQNKIRQLGKYGFKLPKTDLAKMAGKRNLWELRIKSGGSIYRIFLAQLNRQNVVLLHIFQKKTQKTPPREMKTAIKRLQQLKKQGVIWEK
jgi:phage-related protein